MRMPGLTPGVTIVMSVMALAAPTIEAQGPAKPLPTAPCSQNVDSLAHRIQLDYAGFLLEVTGARRKQFDDTLAALHAAAERTPDRACYSILDALITWFHDPHLFVYQNDAFVDSSGAIRPAPRHDLDESRFREYLAAHQKQLDPIEGIWYDGGMRMVIARDTGARNNSFIAVVLESDTAGWDPGDVRARFIPRRNADGYDGQVWSKNHAYKQLTAIIHKRLMLRLSPGIWGKEFPILAADRGLVNRADAHRATLQTRGHAVVISIPSHDPAVRSALDTLLTMNDSLIRHAEHLIIDLRGNEGGSAGVTDGLLPFIVTDSERPSRYPLRGSVILSSPDQIRYVSRAFVPSTADDSAGLKRLLARMTDNPGKLVPLADSLDPPSTPRKITPVYGPKKVAVMTDRGTVSASEVLVLDALKSTRAIVIGEPTEGALDYQSTSIVWFTPLERRWGLGYPTVTRNAELPKNGMRGVGILPDVRVDWNKIADPIGHVDSLLSSRTTAPR
jgi:hypothetical protein